MDAVTLAAAKSALGGPLTPRGALKVAWLGDSMFANGAGNSIGYVGTVNTAANVSDTSLIVDHPYSGYPSPVAPGTNHKFVLEPGTAREEWFVASAVSGSGPYTLTIPALTYAHAQGAAIRAVASTYGPTSVPMWTALLSGNRLKLGGIYAHSGYTTAQIRTVYLPQILATNPLPGVVMVCSGTNDTYDLVSALPLMLDMLDQLRRRGILPVAVGVPPAGSASPSTTDITNKMKWNSRLAAECDKRGIPFVDSFAALASTATNGSMLATYSTDNTHPGPIGCKTWAQAIINTVTQWFPYTADTLAPRVNIVLTDTTTYPANPSNALMLNDGNSDGIPDGWSQVSSASPTSTVSLATESGVPGKMFSVTRAVNATGTVWYQESFTLIAGHRYRAYLRLKSTGADAAYDALATTTSGIQNSTFAGFNVRMVISNADLHFSLNGWSRDLALTTISHDFVAPKNANGQGLSFVVSLGGGSTTPSYTVEAQPWLEDLTQLGYA